MNENEAKEFIENHVRKIFSEDAGEHRKHLEQQFAHLKWGAATLFGLFGIIFILMLGKSIWDFNRQVKIQINEFVLTEKVQSNLHKRIKDYMQSKEAKAVINNTAIEKVLDEIRSIPEVDITKAFDTILKDKINEIENIKPESLIIPTGTILPYGGRHENRPVGWLPCDGREVKIDDYPDLYRVIGDVFGVSKKNWFKLPDFRGRVPIGSGQGTQLSDRILGRNFGSEQHVLTIDEMPSHRHKTKGPPQFRVAAEGHEISAGDGETDEWTEPSGGGTAHNNMQPSLVVNFIIKAK